MNVAEARSRVRRRQRQSRTSDRDAFELGGGLNLVDPPATIRPGFCLAAENYEIGVNGGYERLGGFERFDGHDAPSDEPYYVIPLRHSVAFPSILQSGQLVTGATAGSATVIEGVELTQPGGNYAWFTEDLSSWHTPTGISTVAEVTSTIGTPQPQEFAVHLLGNGVPGSTAFGASKALAPRRAWEIVEDAGSSGHWADGIAVAASPGIAIGDRLLLSVFVKRRDRRYCLLRVQLGGVFSGSGGTFPETIFDLQELAVVSSTTQVASAGFEDVEYGDGWQRIYLVTTAASSLWASRVDLQVGTVNDSLATSFVGDGASGLYVTGSYCDVQNGTVPPLVPFAASRVPGATKQPAGVAYVVVRDVTVSFAIAAGGDQNFRDASNTVLGLASGAEQLKNAPTLEEHLDYLKTVADLQRLNILKVPGDGVLRGVWFYKGVVYAFRDDTSGTPDVCKMYKSTTAGWVQVTFAPHLDFDAGLAAGATAIVEGATITGGTSGATAVVKRINLINSNWAGSLAAGTLVLASVTGTFQNNEGLLVGATPVATEDGIVYTPTWTNGGRYRFRSYNFYGASDKLRMYGVNGLNRAFEFDSTDGILASYRTGMTIDTPTRLATHLAMLFLFFPGGSQQNSGIGRPANWTVVTGAAEIALGDEVTDVLEEVGDSLFVFGRNTTFQLTGKTLATFSLDRFDKGNGAIANSVQRIGMGVHLDDRGFGSLASSDKFGNYEANTFSRLIQPLVNRLLKNAAVTESVIYRGGNRYRCFFDDGSFISIGVSGQKITGHMVCNYGKVVRVACSSEDTDGTERIFFGSDDGYVYEAEKGTSFDGKPVRGGLRPAYHHSGYPSRNKRYRAGRIEAILNGQATLYVTPDLSFGKTRKPELEITASVGGAIWDHTMEWENFNWDEVIEPLKPFTVNADGINIGLAIRHESDVERPHTLRAIIYQSALRGMQRSTAVG